ncbi:MAG: XRE family transcriptional regulator [Proteobacteria bacterium]|nr:XRE family transcriptional regulator [Pseudomonadota bacterium]NDC23343.1 XRE family transcriptional regulator [Pseudomonadota bacterium]NDG26679.1 XRE family transcriptional regulator [Pseudomonadota bacterium]
MKDETIKSEAELGKVLKGRRNELQITQKELADYCNLSHNGISQIEVGGKSIRLSTLLKLGKILGFKVVLKMED